MLSEVDIADNWICGVNGWRYNRATVHKTIKNEIFNSRLEIISVYNGSSHADVLIKILDGSFKDIQAEINAKILNKALASGTLKYSNIYYIEGIWTFKKIGTHVRLVEYEA